MDGGNSVIERYWGAMEQSAISPCLQSVKARRHSEKCSMPFARALPLSYGCSVVRMLIEHAHRYDVNFSPHTYALQPLLAIHGDRKKASPAAASFSVRLRVLRALLQLSGPARLARLR